MIKILIIIIVIAALLTGGDRTAKSLVTATVNCFLLAVLVFVMSLGINPLMSGIVCSVLIAMTTIFFQNEVNIKTKAAFISVIITVAISLLLIYLFVNMGHLQGISTIGDEKFRETNGYSGKIGINMLFVQIVVFILILMGCVIDAAVAISSGMYEILQLNPNIETSSLIDSGKNIGQNILSSNVNTLIFVFVGEYMIMFINYLNYYSFTTMINSKDFAQSIIAILISALACVIIIPVASFISVNYFKKNQSGNHSESTNLNEKIEK